MVIIFIFNGCRNFNLTVSKATTRSLIEGQWKIEKIKLSNQEEEVEDEVEGTIVSFSNDEALLLGKVYKNVSYKAKVVDKDAYLYEVLGYIPEDGDSDETELTVVTISSNNTFIKDIMFFNEGVYMLENRSLYRLVQINTQPLEMLSQAINDNNDSYYKMDSGVLVGLINSGDDENNYRTLWISNEKGEIKVEELPYLLFPRRSGFFKVTNKRIYNDKNYFKDVIIFEDMNGKVVEFHDDITMEAMLNANIDKCITFIGNDYMSTRTYKYDEDSCEEILSTYVLDLNSIEANKPIPLGTLTDSTDMSNVILPSEQGSVSKKHDINTFTNFAIMRKQGRWSFYTLQEQLNKKNEEDSSQEISIKDNNFDEENVDITLRVSEKIARHDEIFIPWQGIQKQVPSAVDAISSPNRNLAVIKTKSKIYIYKIVNNNLEKESEVVIPIEEKEAIIMAEWAEGDYVGHWSEQVKVLKNK